LQKVKALDGDEENAGLEDTANLVAQAAVLQSNFELDDPQLIVNTVYDLVSQKHNLDPRAPATEVEVVVPEEPKAEEEVDEDDDEEEGADEAEDEPEKPEL